VIDVWRLIKREHAAVAFDGEGARRYGGRWNHKGTAVIYTADSMALAALELFIHLGREGLHLSFVYYRVSIPDDLKITRVGPRSLPGDWRKHPAPTSTRDIGSAWAGSQKTAVLQVPSALVPHGYNFLLNPRHRDFARLKISKPEPFGFDQRMWK